MEKESFWGSWLGFSAVMVVVSVIVLLPAIIFSTQPETYLITNPTESQVRQLIRGDPENRVWYSEINQVMGQTYMIEVTLKARTLEDEKVREFLDRVGVEYERLK